MALVCDSYKSAPFASGAKKMTMAVMLIKCYVIASSFVIVSSTSLANISNETSTTQQSDPIILQSLEDLRDEGNTEPPIIVPPWIVSNITALIQYLIQLEVNVTSMKFAAANSQEQPTSNRSNVPAPAGQQEKESAPYSSPILLLPYYVRSGSKVYPVLRPAYLAKKPLILTSPRNPPDPSSLLSSMTISPDLMTVTINYQAFLQLLSSIVLPKGGGGSRSTRTVSIPNAATINM